MTKQEIYDALVTKFDIVQPISDWELRGSTLPNINTYQIITYSSGIGYKTYNIYEIDGSCEFGRDNPIAEPPVSPVSFLERVKQEIEARKTSGQIVDAFVDMSKLGSTVCEVVAYLESGTDLTRQIFVVWDEGAALGFKKLV